MKRTRAVATGMVVSAAVIGSLLLATPANAADDVVFSDPAFSACVHGQVGTDPTAPITLAQAATVTSLICYQEGVTSIDGIQAFTSLTTVQLAANSITSIAPLSGLTQLTSLEFSENLVTDLTPLAGLTNLTQLSFSYNQASDLSPLAALTALTDIAASSNNISDIGVMAGWPVLERVTVAGNQLADLSPLKDLPNIVQVQAYYQTITCTVAGNQLADLSPLKDLPNIVQVQAYYQTVTLPPLAAGASQANPVRNWNGAQVEVEGESNFVLASDGASWAFTTAAYNTLSWMGEDGTSEPSWYFAGSILQQSLAAETQPSTPADIPSQPSQQPTPPAAVDTTITVPGSTTLPPRATPSLASTGLNVWPLVAFAALLFAGAGVMLRRSARA